MTSADDKYRPEPFDVLNASDPEVEEWYRLRSGYRREVLPEDPEVTKEESLSEARALDSIQVRRAWAVWRDDGSMAAYCAMHTSSLGYMKNHAVASILVRSDMRCRGIGTLLLGRVVEGAASLDRKELHFYSSDRSPSGTGFLERIGARIKHRSLLSQLSLNRVDPELIRSWLEYPCTEDIPIRTGIWNGLFPEERLEEVSEFYQTVIDHDREPGDDPVDITPDAIRKGDETALRQGINRLVLFAVDGNDGLIGFSEVLWSDRRPSILRQGYTAVLPEFRRKGIGRRLKAEMMTRILSELPQAEVIRAGNDEKRAAIRKINEKMGYRPFITNYTWEISTPELERYLQDR